MPSQLLVIEPKLSKVISHLKVELAGIRSGRATPVLVEHVKVEAYGTMTPLIELASITAPEPRLLVVSPWDKSIIKEVEKALLAANLGVQPTVDGAVIRLNFPSLTEERRLELTKHVSLKLEEAKVAVRNVRRHAKDELEGLEGDVSDDEIRRAERFLENAIPVLGETGLDMKSATEDFENALIRQALHLSALFITALLVFG